MSGRARTYNSAVNYVYNITELAQIFDLSRDTVRRRLRQFSVQPFGKKSGSAVYVLKEAALAMSEYESQK